MSAVHSDQQLRPLPIRPRPRAGESVESYVRILARANHLRPSYLHHYLSGPYPNGRLRIERLAVLAGRPAEHLQRALSGITAPRRPGSRHRQPAMATKARADERAATFAAIRRDHQREGLSARKLAARHKVGRRTINQALSSPKPPHRKKHPPRGSRALGEATGFIDAILQHDLALPPHRRHSIQRIWERLLDEHDTTAAYSTIRTYVTNRRNQLADNNLPETPDTVPAENDRAHHPETRLNHEIRSAVRQFAFRLAKGILDPEILGGLNYRPHLMTIGSELEMAFTIFTNVLTIDNDGHVINQPEAQRRAAQWIRAYCSPGYQIDPPLQGWETELI